MAAENSGKIVPATGLPRNTYFVLLYNDFQGPLDLIVPFYAVFLLTPFQFSGLGKRAGGRAGGGRSWAIFFKTVVQELSFLLS